MDRTQTAAPSSHAPVLVQAGEVRLARLESVRALAALAVLVGHAYAIPRRLIPSPHLPGRLLGSGFWGVFVFFALSGYLMTRPLLAAQYGGKPVDLGRYFRNRALRVLPLYYVVLAVVLVVRHGGGDGHTWLKYGLFLENQGRRPADVVDGPMWSLVVEVQFYLLIPLVIWLLAKAARTLPQAGVGLAVLTVVTLVLQQELPVHTLNDTRSFAVTAFWFTPGMLLAWLQLTLKHRPKGLVGHSDTWALAAAIAWGVAVHRHRPDVAVAVASLLLLGACVLPLARGVTTRLLDLRGLAAIGVISYGIYLWHLPLLQELLDAGVPNRFAPLLLTTLAGALLISTVTYRFVERPFLKLRQRW